MGSLGMCHMTIVSLFYCLGGVSWFCKGLASVSQMVFGR